MNEFQPTGFPSPAEGHIENTIDLNAELTPHPSSTFFLRIKDDAYTDYCLPRNTVLIVDRSLLPRKHDLVVADYEGERSLYLAVEVPVRFRPLTGRPGKLVTPSLIWGVVTQAIVPKRL